MKKKKLLKIISKLEKQVAALEKQSRENLYRMPPNPNLDCRCTLRTVKPVFLKEHL